MSGLTFTESPSSALPDKPLGAPDVGVDLIGGTVGYQTEPELAGVKFVLGVQGNAGVCAFNSKDDKDLDCVLGQPVRVDSEFGEVLLPPQIQLTEDHAWLKYRLSARAKVGVSGAISPVEFKIDGSKEVIFADYRIHSRDENTRISVLDDLQKIRFAANVTDAFQLANSEALLYQVRGELSASVTLSWSDIYTSAISSLSRLLRSGHMLSVQISPTASVKFHVGVVDDFRLVISKGISNKVRIALKKSDSRDLGVTASLAVTVKFANEADVENALATLYEAIVGKTKSQLETVFAKATFEDLNSNERLIASGIIERLGLGDAVHTLAELKHQLNVLDKEISSIITTVAKAKVELGFTYEYLHVRTEDILLTAEMDQATFKVFHTDLMLCEIRRMLDWLEHNPDALKSYLNQKSVKRSQAWGFTLGVGPWKLSGKDKKDLVPIVQKDIEGKERMAYLGMRSYRSESIGNEAGWVVDFKAQMKEFSTHQSPTASEFQFGLHCRLSWTEKKLKEHELRGYLDDAVIWRVLALGNLSEVVEKVKANLEQKAEVSVELVIDDETFRSLLAITRDAPNQDLGARALAKAMPYMEEYDARRNPILRECCYAPLWKYYFEHDDLPINVYPSIAANTIDGMTQLEHQKELAARERGFGTNRPAYMDVYTFGGQIYHQGNTATSDYTGVHRNWMKFVEGMKTLDRAIDPARQAPHKIIEQCFELMSGFWSQWLYVRALGAYFLDLAATKKDLLDKINRACTISFKAGEIYTFGSSV